MLLWAFIIFFVIYYFKSPLNAANSVKRALDVCAVGLIPSLFPFTAAVGIMNASGLSWQISRLCGRFIGKIFSVSEDSAYAVILGAIGGFPIGAVCVRDLYDKGGITKDEAERLLTFVSNAGPAFCIGTVGSAVFHDTGFGIKLYFCQLAASVIIGVFQRRGGNFQKRSYIRTVRGGILEIVGESIHNAGLAMLKICSFAVFFAVIGDAVCLAAEPLFGASGSVLPASFFEITLAVRRASELNGTAAFIMGALAVGWSGLSVHMQTASIISGCGISMKRYYPAKAVQGVLTALLVILVP